MIGFVNFLAIRVRHAQGCVEFRRRFSDWKSETHARGFLPGDFQAEPFRASGFGVFSKLIAARGLFRSAVVCVLGTEITQAIVMLGGHYHIFLTCLFRESGPGPGGIGSRIELLGEQRIFADWDSFIFHHPFVTASDLSSSTRSQGA